jgi:hypothetical protein
MDAMTATSEPARHATFAAVEGDTGAGRDEPAMSGETSSRTHRLSHAYAELGDAFPGALGIGATVQTVVLATANVGQPAVLRADEKAATRRRSE